MRIPVKDLGTIIEAAQKIVACASLLIVNAASAVEVTVPTPAGMCPGCDHPMRVVQ